MVARRRRGAASDETGGVCAQSCVKSVMAVKQTSKRGQRREERRGRGAAEQGRAAGARASRRWQEGGGRAVAGKGYTVARRGVRWVRDAAPRLHGVAAHGWENKWRSKAGDGRPCRSWQCLERDGCSLHLLLNLRCKSRGWSREGRAAVGARVHGVCNAAIAIVRSVAAVRCRTHCISLTDGRSCLLHFITLLPCPPPPHTHTHTTPPPPLHTPTPTLLTLPSPLRTPLQTPWPRHPLSPPPSAAAAAAACSWWAAW